MNTIKIHSIIDLITNSSTEIYTYSENSIKVLKEMVEEIFAISNIQEKFEDIFSVIMLMDDYYYYKEFYNNFEVNKNNEINIMDLYTQVSNGEIEKPQWFFKAEEYKTKHFNTCPPSTVLFLSVKNSKYKRWAELIIKFLYSTSHDGCYNG